MTLLWFYICDMRGLIVFLFLLSVNSLVAQVDHWESVVKEGQEWQYLLPSGEPSANWSTTNFDASTWNTGISGFGYGDNDDATIVAPTLSIYLRKTFEIVDINSISEVLFHMDYDDGYVAYINGVEISRSFMDGNPPTFNQSSSGLHEPQLVFGQIPSAIPVDINLLVNGENVLAVQVHNENINSSDLTANPFLSLGINDTSNNYFSTPDWFSTPLVFTESNLPLVFVHTNGQAINADNKIEADFGIVFNGANQTNAVDDPQNEYKGKIGIKIRGESSQFFDKKSYAIETWDANQTDIDTSFLNFPPEEDFILYGPFSDKTLINNVLAMDIGNKMGHYASRTRMVELMLNDQYQGVYVFMEKIKRDKNRVDIAKLKPDEITGDDLTGGYIFRIDKGVFDGWSSKFNIFQSPNKLFFQFHTPDQDDIQPEQAAYIQNYMDEFETAIAADSGIHPNGKHYTEYINLRSFVDNFIINELSKNVDAYRLSTYFHKDKDSKGGKITAGPFWDFNLSFGNGDYCSGDDVTGWEYYQCPGNSPFWWDRFLEDPIFRNALRCRWESLREDILSHQAIDQYIDSLTTTLAAHSTRNFDKWQILGQYVWPNPPYFSNPTSHSEIITTMKQWIRQRTIWLDQNIPGVAETCEIYDEDYEFTTAVENLTEPINETCFFPNPTSSGITIQCSVQIQSVAIINQLGQTMYSESVNSKLHYLSLNGKVSPGQYILSVSTEEGQFIENLVVE